jgi:transcriptional regulator with XRE-family HTH domain
MDNRPLTFLIRAKKLGVLMQSARQTAGKSIQECAEILGISPAEYQGYEKGERSPSLPELETLAYYLKIPLDHFWGREIISARPGEHAELPVTRLLTLRNRIIGVMLRQARLQAGLTTTELARKAGIDEEQLKAYEFGETPIPLPELEILANELRRTVKDFQDTRGPVGIWIKQQRAMQHFAELSPELQDFISKPVNRPYLELAQRLSEMSVERLRSVAEGLLEITL